MPGISTVRRWNQEDWKFKVFQNFSRGTGHRWRRDAAGVVSLILVALLVAAKWSSLDKTGRRRSQEERLGDAGEVSRG